MKSKTKFSLYTFAYAVLYSFCLYKNLGGATFPFFVIGTLCYMQACIKEFGLTLKKDSILYMIGLVLIGFSQVLTANPVIQVLNFLVVSGFILWLIIHNFNDDGEWNFFTIVINLIVSLANSFFKMFTPFKDWRMSKKEGAESDTDKKASFPIASVLVAVIITIPFLSIVILLLSSSDFIFRDWVSRFFKFDWISDLKLGAIFLCIIAFLTMYGLMSFSKAKVLNNLNPKIKGNPAGAITTAVMYDVVYLIFSFIQIFYLFIGNFSLPEGTSYAVYARSGFFELLFVCLLNVVLVLIGMSFFEDNKLLKILLTIMCACTYIMTASSAFRMILYIRYYYFTFLRISVLWALVLIFVLITGLLVYIWYPKFKLTRFMFSSALVLYIVLSFSRVDYLIAKWNLAQTRNPSNTFFYNEKGFMDYEFLIFELCDDAAPVLLDDSTVNAKFPEYREALQEKTFSVRKFNISEFVAHNKALH